MNRSIDWEAVAAIGAWLGAIATFSAVIVALYPYFRKIKIYFDVHSYIEHAPVLTILNRNSNSVMIEKVQYYAGPVIFNKLLYEDNFIQQQDDLSSDKTSPLIEPNTYKKIIYNSGRIIHDLSHRGYGLKIRKYRNLRVMVKTNLGKRVINTRIKTDVFIKQLISDSDIYRHLKIEDLI